MQQKILIIVGMHRSGTSLITQWLYRCGLQVGEDLLGPGIGNDDGHYEDLAFYNFQVEALRNKNFHDSGFTIEPVPPLTGEERNQLRTIISHKNSLFIQWGWKDPRTCLFLREYKGMIPDAYHLVVFRDWQSTVGSLISRTYKVEYANNEIIKKGLFTGFRKRRAYQKRIRNLCVEHASFFLKVWIFYNQEILDSLASMEKDQYAVVNYERLLKSDKALFSHLTNAWNFSLDYVNFNDIYKPGLLSKKINISKFVDKSLIGEAQRIQELLEQKAGISL